jgi:RNA polymerase sigma factor (sigma-70 family)
MSSDTSDFDSLLELLEKVESSHRDVVERQAAREVDNLLDRAPLVETTTLVSATTSKKSVVDAAEDRLSGGAFDWYQPLVAAVPELDVDGTVEAAKAIEVGLLARERLGFIDIATTSRSELIALHTLAENGEAEFERLVLSNVRLVFYWVKPVARAVGEDWLQDAFQVGVIGLMRGIEGWDYKRGFALSTYVSWHIRQAIQRWKANEVDLIRLPVHVTEKLKKSPDQLSSEVHAAIKRSRALSDLDDVVDVDEGLVWDGGLGAVASSLTISRSVEQILGTLNEKQADVLRMRFGLVDGLEMTLDQIGLKLGVTRERIRQIEKKAFEQSRRIVAVSGIELET